MNIQALSPNGGRDSHLDFLWWIFNFLEWPKISVSYEANWLTMPDCLTAHLQVQSVSPEKEPLPITKTGYRSHFLLFQALCDYRKVLAALQAVRDSAQ